MPRHDDRAARDDPYAREMLKAAGERLRALFAPKDEAAEPLSYPLPECEHRDECGVMACCLHQCHDKDWA